MFAGWWWGGGNFKVKLLHTPRLLSKKGFVTMVMCQWSYGNQPWRLCWVPEWLLCCPWLYLPRFILIILPTVGAILSGNTHKVCFMMQLSFYDVLCGYTGNGSIAKLANSMHLVVSLQGFVETYWEPQIFWKFCIIVVAYDFRTGKSVFVASARRGVGLVRGDCPKCATCILPSISEGTKARTPAGLKM